MSVIRRRKKGKGRNTINMLCTAVRNRRRKVVNATEANVAQGREENSKDSKPKITKVSKKRQGRTGTEKEQGKSKEYICPTCQGDANEGVVECCKCERWCHFACAGLEDMVNSLEHMDWDCVECETEITLFKTADEVFVTDGLMHATGTHMGDGATKGDEQQSMRAETISKSRAVNNDGRGVMHDASRLSTNEGVADVECRGITPVKIADEVVGAEGLMLATGTCMRDGG